MLENDGKQLRFEAVMVSPYFLHLLAWITAGFADLDIGNKELLWQSAEVHGLALQRSCSNSSFIGLLCFSSRAFLPIESLHNNQSSTKYYLLN